MGGVGGVLSENCLGGGSPVYSLGNQFTVLMSPCSVVFGEGQQSLANGHVSPQIVNVCAIVHERDVFTTFKTGSLLP